MQQMVKEKCQFLGSSADKDKVKKILAFSLAEMLIVLLIMSFMAIGIPLIHYKKNEMKTKRSLHGRFECYYENGNLMQYTVSEEGTPEPPINAPGGQCKFTPPKSAIFFLVHAVGGGGGASTTPGSGGVNTNDTETLTFNSNQVNTFPDWGKNAMGAGYLDDAVAPYKLVRRGSSSSITYGHSGSPGETISMFFPNLTNVQILMTPGVGGRLGEDGTETNLEFWQTDREHPEVATTKLADITVAGGKGGTGSGQMKVWLDGEMSLCDIKEFAGRKFNASDFSYNIEIDTDTNMETQLNDDNKLAGSGGAGGYYNPGPAPVTYSINDVPVPNDVIKKPICVNPTTCDDGSNNPNCPAQEGKDGAIVILW